MSSPGLPQGKPVREAARVGPGRLVLVVGPSGAGKDTLIAAVRMQLADEEAFLFPRRIVTRPSSIAEDNAEADEATFLKIAEAGGFALTWSAHGHRYGIPAMVDHALYGGRTVVCNVSREVIAEARQRYRHVTVVEVTAPPEVLHKRISARSRPSDGDAAARLERRISTAAQADIVIVNDGPVEGGARQLLAVVTEQPGLLSSSRT
jgi:ribose 1,5-bisphosphokinase